MIPEATSYWSEHSERGEGRWSPGVDEEYAVTSKEGGDAGTGSCGRKDQGAVQHHRLHGMTGRFLNNFALWLQAVHGMTPTQAHAEIKKIAPPTWGGMGNGPFHVLSKPIKKKAEGPEVLEVLESPTEVFSDDEVMDDPAPEERYNLGTYILSVVGKTKRRTLRVIGGCYRVPGVHYRDFVVVGMERPEILPDQGERLCSTCFTKKDSIGGGPSAGRRWRALVRFGVLLK